MKDIKFNGKAYEEFIEWAETDKDIYDKIKTLLKDISRDPFKGLGKPEIGRASCRERVCYAV